MESEIFVDSTFKINLIYEIRQQKLVQCETNHEVVNFEVL